jgi:hypothetical protein
MSSSSARKRKAIGFNSEEDIGVDLLAALEKGATGEKNRFHRNHA